MSNIDSVTELIRKHKEGLTVSEIASLLKISRNTAAVALANLEGAGKIKVRAVGMAKLHYWTD